MNSSEEINVRVEVVVMYRTRGDSSTWCFPYKMKYQGREVTFTELGLRHPTTKGMRMVHVFDMSDGANDYRLEFDAGMLTWKLLAIMEGHDGR